MKDIYGTLPREVETLFIKRSIDLLVRESEIESLQDYSNRVEIIAGDKYIKIKGIGNILFESLIPHLNYIKVSYANNRFKIVMTKRKNWTKDLENILESLTNIVTKNKVKEIVWD